MRSVRKNSNENYLPNEIAKGLHVDCTQTTDRPFQRFDKSRALVRGS